MTDRELKDFIEHGENGFVDFALTFGDGWAIHAIEIAKELRARLAQTEQEELARLEQAMIEAWKPIPKREWVGLTPADRVACEQSAKGNYVALWAAIEAKLKEKNT